MKYLISIIGLIIFNKTKLTNLLYCLVLVVIICLAPVVGASNTFVLQKNSYLVVSGKSTYLKIAGSLVMHNNINGNGTVVLQGANSAGSSLCLPTIISNNYSISNLHIKSGIVCLGSDLHVLGNLSYDDEKGLELNGHKIYVHNIPNDNFNSISLSIGTNREIIRTTQGVFFTSGQLTNPVFLLVIVDQFPNIITKLSQCVSYCCATTKGLNCLEITDILMPPYQTNHYNGIVPEPNVPPPLLVSKW